MINLETVAIRSVDVGRSVAEDSRPERVDLPPSPEAVNLKLKNQQTKSEVHLPGPVEEDLSAPSTSNTLSINNREAILPSYSNSNKSDVKCESREQTLIYEKCMNYFLFFGFVLGMRMSYNWKPQRYFMFFVMTFCLFFVAFSVLYTVYVHCINDSYIRALEPLALTGITVSCYLKLYAFLENWFRILSLVFAIRKHFRQNVFGRPAEIVKTSLRKTWTFLITYAISICLCCVFYTLTPIMVYVTTNEVTPLLPVEIVFCDQSQISGFVVATIVHLIMGFYGTMATLFNGAVIIFCFRNYILQGDLIADDFQVLDGMWNGENNVSVDYKRAFLKNICIKRQDMNNFLNIVKEVYEMQFFIYFCCGYFSQIICLYDITQNDWIGGYGAAFLLFFEMMFYCYMGTQVSIVITVKFLFCDRTTNLAILSAITIGTCTTCTLSLFLVHQKQPGVDNTAQNIVKSIYSYYTVLTELF